MRVSYQSVAWLSLLVQVVHCELLIDHSTDPSFPTFAANETVANCDAACTQIQTRTEIVAHYPNVPKELRDEYFARQQRDTIPICIIQPRTAEDVSEVVKAVTAYKCPFAVKSGGHSIAQGSSTRNQGLVLDLKLLNHIKISEDKTIASIGPGNRWRDVYRKLEPEGLTVAGGRSGDVGVGGFTLGGGISFISRQYGWAIDNVRNFQVVLPNATVTNANIETNPDLYFALRGGGSNFGIVTSFDFETHEHDLLWGGTDVNFVRGLTQNRLALGIPDTYDWSLHSALRFVAGLVRSTADMLGYGTLPQSLVDGFVSLSKDTQTDVGAHGFLFYSWMPPAKSYLIGSTFAYNQPVEKPAALSGLVNISNVFNTRKMRKMSDFAQEVEGLIEPGLRHNWRTSTFKVNSEFISELWNIFLVETNDIRLVVPDAVLSYNLQLLTKHEISLFSRNGGNAFGITEDEGPLFLFSVTVGYHAAAHDEVVQKTVERLISRAVALGKERGLYHPFIYANYAAADQDFFSGFSPENRKRLLDIQELYDPGQVFASLLPEHSRLSSA